MLVLKPFVGISESVCTLKGTFNFVFIQQFIVYQWYIYNRSWSGLISGALSFFVILQRRPQKRPRSYVVWLHRDSSVKLERHILANFLLQIERGPRRWEGLMLNWTAANQSDNCRLLKSFTPSRSGCELKKTKQYSRFLTAVSNSAKDTIFQGLNVSNSLADLILATETRLFDPN